ncbi:MAG: SDR family oxidoreductase [Firmicutes bacterium]|nr:SDR family oxidoreductase [Bacillota bacterium]
MIPSVQLIDLKGRRAMITGAAAGIGKAMALRFADAGADCILLDIDETGLLSVREELQTMGGRASTVRVDLRGKEEIDALWMGLSDEGLPDILINNVGVYALKDYLEIDEDFLDTTLAVNLESVFWMCQRFIQRRLKSGGIIVNVSTIEALLPFKKDLVAYGTSKAAVIALTRALARDYGPHGFRLNVILPGAIKTPSTKRLMKMAIQRARLDLIKTGYDFQSRLALGRWGNPDEVARVALFLSSELATYVQGAVIPVDGGFLSS